MTRRQGVAALVFIAIVWGCCFTLIKQTLELIGMYFLTRPGGMSAGINLGDVLTVACAVLFAFHIVAAGHYASTGRPERLLALELALTGGLSALAAPVLETPRFVLGPATLPAVGFLGVTAAVTFYLQLGAQRVVSPAATAIIFTLEGLAAAVTSWIVLGETLTPTQWLGGMLILGGTILPFVTAVTPALRTAKRA